MMSLSPPKIMMSLFSVLYKTDTENHPFLTNTNLAAMITCKYTKSNEKIQMNIEENNSHISLCVFPLLHSIPAAPRNHIQHFHLLSWSNNILSHSIYHNSFLSHSICDNNILLHSICVNNILLHSICDNNILSHSICDNNILSYSICDNNIHCCSMSRR